MPFLNRKEILQNAETDAYLRLRDDTLTILEAAVLAVDPYEAIMRSVDVEGNRLRIRGEEWDLEGFSEVYIIGGGKASGAMAEAVERILGERIIYGVINVLRGTENDLSLERISVNAASHPVPDEGGVRGVERMMELLDGVTERDLVIVLLSGGGSSLMPLPADGVHLEEIREVTGKLLLSGATINELNAVRKHLSAIKGGQIAQRAHPSTVVSLILSDVVGDPLDTIASGPTAPDDSTYADAVEVLKSYDLWENTSPMIKQRLTQGSEGTISETPKKGDSIFRRVHNFVVGSNLTAAEAALGKAEALGYNSLLLTTEKEGEAREVGAELGKIALEIVERHHPLEPPAAIIVGGETTVTVTGGGIGGRNQEVALAAAMRIDGLDAVIASFATDGIDGPTEAAGALVDGATMRRAREENLDPSVYLDENDSNTFFIRLNDVLLTGPTGTNVNDLAVILVGEPR